MNISPVRINLNAIDTLVMAGGGNRCWWQAGLMNTWLSQEWQLPRRIIATSAGAAIATAFFTTGVQHALDACKNLYACNSQVFDWKALASLGIKFAHQHIYLQASLLLAAQSENTITDYA